MRFHHTSIPLGNSLVDSHHDKNVYFNYFKLRVGVCDICNLQLNIKALTNHVSILQAHMVFYDKLLLSIIGFSFLFL